MMCMTMDKQFILSSKILTTIEFRGVFMLQMSTLLCKNYVNCRSKTNDFASNYLE